MQSNSIETHGLTMRWEEAGTGVPVVFVHGIPTNPSLWRHVISALPGVWSLAWEMVGYGRSISEGVGRDISVGRQADYLIQWMDAINLDEAVLVGHDLGGGVAQIAAVRHPERVKGLVLTNAIAYDSWPIPSVKILRAMGPLLQHAPSAFVYLIQTILFVRGHDNLDAVKEALRAHWPPYHRADGAAALIRQMQSLNVEDTLAIADRLPDLDLPAAMVWGAADPFQPIKYGDQLASDLGGYIDPIAGGKHFVPEDHPDRIADAVEHVVGQL